MWQGRGNAGSAGLIASVFACLQFVERTKPEYHVRPIPNMYPSLSQRRSRLAPWMPLTLSMDGLSCFGYGFPSRFFSFAHLGDAFFK